MDVARTGAGHAQYTVNLSQKYQKISGDVSAVRRWQPLVGATVRGEEIRFAFNDDKGVTRTLTGTVRGNELTGTLKGAERTETRLLAPANKRYRTFLCPKPRACGAFCYFSGQAHDQHTKGTPDCSLAQRPRCRARCPQSSTQ